MRRIILRVFTGVSIAALAGLLSWGPAQADAHHGKNVLRLQIGCDNEQAYAAVTNGNGRLRPLHDVLSKSVLRPVAASKALVTLLDQDLNVVTQRTDPAVSKPGQLKHGRKGLLTCDVVGFQPRADGTTETVLETMLVRLDHGH